MSATDAVDGSSTWRVSAVKVAPRGGAGMSALAPLSGMSGLLADIVEAALWTLGRRRD
jgi:hypothetical protein